MANGEKLTIDQIEEKIEKLKILRSASQKARKELKKKIEQINYGLTDCSERTKKLLKKDKEDIEEDFYKENKKYTDLVDEIIRSTSLLYARKKCEHLKVGKESKEPKKAKESKESKESNETKESNDTKESKDKTFLSDEKEIPGYPGYSVTKDGRVFRRMSTKRKHLANTTMAGYKAVCIRKNNKSYRRPIHKLVAITWIENPKNLPIVNHKDADIHNNHVDNLEFVTQSENCQHSIKMGLRKNMGDPVYKLNFDNEILGIYDNVYQAGKDNNLQAGWIKDVCIGNLIQYSKHLWCYVSDHDPNNPGSSVTQMGKGGKILKIFKSVEEAHQDTKVSKKDIYLSCSNYRGGIGWKYTLSSKDITRENRKEKRNKEIKKLNLNKWKINSDFPDYKISSDGRVYSMLRNMLLSQQKLDYILISLKDKNGNRKIMRIHRLVAMTYIPNPKNFPVVNHLDGDPYNNNVNNLEWTNSSNNTIHAINIGLTNLKKIDKLDDKGKVIATYRSRNNAAEMNNLSHYSISRAIVTNKCKGGYYWKFSDK